VNIAVGLLADPPVLLLDEPSSALDPRQRERLWEFILGLARGGTTVMFSTHDVGEAERYADRVLVLADGELLFAGTPHELESAVDGEPCRHRPAADGRGALQRREPAQDAGGGVAHRLAAGRCEQGDQPEADRDLGGLPRDPAARRVVLAAGSDVLGPRAAAHA